MEVTSKNFKETHEKIENLLKNQEIVSISFGALTSKGQEGAYKSYDYPFDLYFKNFRFSKTGLVQIALTFIEKVNEYQYKAHPFIFYLFPNDEQTQIVLSSDLFDLDIDWNKWMSEGIPFKNKEQIDKYRSQLFNLPKADQKKENYFEMLTKLDETRQEQVKAQIQKLIAFKEDTESELEFNFDTAYSNIRRVYYQYLEEFHPDLIIFKSALGNISVKKCSPEEKKAYDDLVNREREEKVEEQKGASRTFELVFKYCQEKETPFVMFNSLFELSQILSYTVQFLPRSFIEFKQVLINTLPTVIDIKYTLYNLHNQRNIDPSQFVQKNQMQFIKHQLNVVEGVTVNPVTQKTLDIAKIWILEQQKLKNHSNKLFFDKSNWIVSFNQGEKDQLLLPDNRVLLTIVPSDNIRTMSQKRYNIQKTFQELTKFHKKHGVFCQKSDSQNMIIVTIDTTKFNDIDGYKKGLHKLKEAKFDDYEAFYPVLLNAFEDLNRQVGQ